MRRSFVLRLGRWTLGLIWGMSLMTAGLGLWLHGLPLIGLAVTATGEYVLMALVLDDLVRPVNVEVIGFLKLTAGLLAVLSAVFVILDGQAIL